jgi:hypothetical protein
VVLLFEFGGWDVAAGAEQAAVVEPVDVLVAISTCLTVCHGPWLDRLSSAQLGGANFPADGGVLTLFDEAEQVEQRPIRRAIRAAGAR